MAISGVNPKCYILALFVRDDGARFLLGDDPFEFKDNQLHFQQNTMANDVVEVQGNDGYLLAGQVRRPGTQMFDGYVCNGTNSKEDVEAKRRAFLQFFRRSHFYKVIYVFPNGTAIQRKQGFLVDDPTVQELYQQYPEYHVALNFEDVNYYTYEEDDQGHEIYAKEAIVPLARGGATGGLIWDSYGVVWEDPWSLPLSISGVQFQILNNAGARAPIDNVELYGDTYQQTYSGYNLINLVPMTKEQPSYYQQCSIETVADSTLGRNVLHITGTNNFPSVVYQLTQRLESGKYYVLKFTYRSTINNTATRPDLWFAPNWSGNNWDVLSSITNGRMKPGDGDTTSVTPQSTNWKTTSRKFYVDPSQYSSVDTSYSRICFSLGYNSDSGGFEGKEIWLADAELYEITEDEWNADTYTSKDYEPYTGGIPAPSPSYPMPISVVTGEQTVKVTGKNMAQTTDCNISGTNYSMSISKGSVELRSQATNVCFDLNDGTRLGAWIPNYASAPDHHLTSNGGTYIVSFHDTSTSGLNSNTIVGVFTNKRNNAITINNTLPLRNINISLDSDEYVKSILYWIGSGTADCTIKFKVQLEQGSTATTYEPYQGQSYPISLGSIEFRKIGNYQDYIYKSGDDWYVHKDIGYTDLATQTWGGASSELKPTTTITDIKYVSSNQEVGAGLAEKYIMRKASGMSTAVGYIAIDTSAVRVNTGDASITPTGLFYYALATPTDTKITDATLVGQLEALDAMRLFIGENNVLVSTPTPNLPATLAFDYYTKFAAIGAEWEEGGTKGATIVDVDAIDNTYPVWELTGPATNPTLSVLTTNTALTYNGAITASQKLVIDMFNKTATLNGTSVIGNVSGDFVYMAPGTNRLAYTAGNTDAPDSTIYWQEVVG